MGVFWMPDSFVRGHARNLSGSAQRVYMVLCCHANKKGETFVGQRRIAECIGVSKTTVNKAYKELEAYPLLVRSKKMNGKPYQTRLLPVPDYSNKAYQPLVHKECVEDSVKEEKIQGDVEPINRRKEMIRGMENPVVRQQFEAKEKLIGKFSLN